MITHSNPEPFHGPGRMSRAFRELQQTVISLRPARTPNMLTSYLTHGVTRKPKSTGSGGTSGPPRWG